MADNIVIALFQSRGIAEDACNRLRYIGVSPAAIGLRVLHETAPLPDYMEPEIEALEVDPLVLGNVRETFAPYIRNGETAVFVRAANAVDTERAVDTLTQYLPVQITTLTPAPARS